MTPLLAATLLIIPTWSRAQPLGQFQWQLQPFCNVVSLNVTQSGAIYTLDGFDNQCGGANPRAPLVGVAAPNPDSSIGFGLNIVTTPDGAPVHVRATIQLPLLTGNWTDSAGNGGTFAFNGSATGIGPRPAATGGTLSSLSVTGSGTFGGSLSAASVSSPGNGSFGGSLSAGSTSVTGSGAFGGTVSASHVAAATAAVGGTLSTGSLTSPGTGTFAGALAAASISTTGNGTFGGAVFGGSLSVTNNGTFGGTVTADQVVASSDVGILRADGASIASQPQVLFTNARGTPEARLPVTTRSV